MEPQVSSQEAELVATVASTIVVPKNTITQTAIEMLNEAFTAIGSGILGIVVLIRYGFETNNLIRSTAVASLTAGSLYFVYRSTDRAKPSRRKLVFISGCDSGLGFSLAKHTASLGFTVVAGFLNLQSKGAQELKNQHGDNIKEIELNVTSDNSVQLCLEFVERLLNSQNYEFYGLVNNAGVMVFGEFEWQTEQLIQSQINVNLLGTMRLTKAFCPILRQHKGRIITITSHCAIETLPGLAVYGATKAALQGWSDGLRVEMDKYGVKVVQFIPGSFATQSNIMSRHSQHVYEMHEAFTPEQHSFYGEYFKRYNSYLSVIRPPIDPQKINNDTLYSAYENALLDLSPSSVYKVEPFRYWYYHSLFKFSPVKWRDYFVNKFMQMPAYSTDYKDIDIVS